MKTLWAIILAVTLAVFALAIAPHSPSAPATNAPENEYSFNAIDSLLQTYALPQSYLPGVISDKLRDRKRGGIRASNCFTSFLGVGVPEAVPMELFYTVFVASQSTRISAPPPCADFHGHILPARSIYVMLT